MKLVKIKNKYLFQSEIPEGVHTYAVYYDKESKRNRAVALLIYIVKIINGFRKSKPAC